MFQFQTKFHKCWTWCFPLADSVVHFRNASKTEHFLPVPKRVWKWKKYNFIAIFWLFNSCNPMTWQPLSWGRGKKEIRTWVCAINLSQRYDLLLHSDSCNLFLFLVTELTWLVSCLLLVKICFYILKPLLLLLSCALCAGYYTQSAAYQPMEKDNAMLCSSNEWARSSWQNTLLSLAGKCQVTTAPKEMMKELFSSVLEVKCHGFVLERWDTGPMQMIIFKSPCMFNQWWILSSSDLLSCYNHHTGRYRSPWIQLMLSMNQLFDCNLSLFYVSQVSRYFSIILFPKRSLSEEMCSLARDLLYVNTKLTVQPQHMRSDTYFPKEKKKKKKKKRCMLPSRCFHSHMMQSTTKKQHNLLLTLQESHSFISWLEAFHP